MGFLYIPALYIGRSGQWILAGELRYESGICGLVRVPEGFETDLASIPRMFRWLLPQNDGHHRAAAIVHDYLCRERQVPRSVADSVFLEAMTALGEHTWRRYTMYGAVRLFSIWLKLTGQLQQ